VFDPARTRESTIAARLPFRYLFQPAPDAQDLLLILHGYGGESRRIEASLADLASAKTSVLIPNAPFPAPTKQDDGAYREGYAWYFFESKSQTFAIQPDIAIQAIFQLLTELKLHTLPLRIIGFSQGGFFAPYLGQHLKQTAHVIGIGGGFPERFYQSPPAFRLDGIHGKKDAICSHDTAKQEHAALVAKGWRGEFISLDETEHKIDEPVRTQVRRLLQHPLS